ncbi:16S rRNA (guanine(527)-N(7))-methyltransferase RsmG [Paraflavitalea soli]|uniref:Ribosomal RNA small subunit methyltransferase G n=1 Tax=Paraflavitalea soli TaxID=2315862 RepID=A0A3B7MX44_9BACT|nr:16S rRNA (guanine(527)-N(7))-methyltransferase RsmG [Paraflavitalea soli]AXY77586.1 16S rRNA (guanine(527)-N(7))-methyltransferase RsmG [Paraflavitalea soli]
MEKAQEKLALITKYFGDFTPAQLEQFAALEPLYTDWNSKINVISRKDMESLYEKHVLHSLSIAAAFEWAPGTEVVDLGTGGGFPGIPLAIFYPEVRFHLVDSIGKKIKVVQAVSEGLGLTNVTAQHSRIEDIKNRKFDFVVSRAVAPLQHLWQWSRPLLKKPSATQHRNPGLICLKGGDLAAEISESGCKPTVLEMYEIFREAYFKEKYLLFVPNT